MGHVRAKLMSICALQRRFPFRKENKHSPVCECLFSTIYPGRKECLQRPSLCTASRSSDGGEGGIRTHDEFPRTRFPGERPRPLGDLSRRFGPLIHSPGLLTKWSVIQESLYCEDWRRGWDSNPRRAFQTLTRFRDELLQPLGHLSKKKADRWVGCCVAGGARTPDL